MKARSLNRRAAHLSDRGYSFEGPGYYVWDEDFETAHRAAVELEGGSIPERTPHRMLRVGPDAASFHSVSPEALDA